MTVFSSTDLILFSLFCFAFLIQIYYYLFVFSRLAFYKQGDKDSVLPPVSVIICARSEQNNLSEHLAHILNQNYPEYEVVVVDDCSYDSTDEVLKKFSTQYPHLKIVTIKEDKHYTHGKKLAQLVGIKGAKYEHLLFTDADCKPVDKEWVKKMMGGFDEKTEIVLGYGAYEKTNKWLNKLIRFDTFYIALQYFSLALIKKPYMGVGRNLAYKKSLFFKNRGFASHYHLESGDDDLFVSEAATENNCRIEIDPASRTVSKAKTNYADWIKQKRRHITTGTYYDLRIKIGLGILTASPYLFFTFFILLLCTQTYFIIATACAFIVRYIVQMIIFNGAMKKLGEKDLLSFSILLELQLLFFYPIFLFTNIFSRKKNRWKS